MTHLKVSIGQYSDKGPKSTNQDFHGAMLVDGKLSESKGVAVAIADGISSSEVSHIASETSIKGFLNDYYATPETWSVKTSGQRVIQASNSWLYSQTRNGPHRYNLDRGYVCTFSALVIKSNTVHIFHVGDARVFSVQGNRLELLTEDHRVKVSSEKSYLSRALGMRERLEIDYLTRTADVGDLFILATDGAYEFMQEKTVIAAIRDHADDLDQAARTIIESAIVNNADDNLTIQIVRVDELPPLEVRELQDQAVSLPFPPDLKPRMNFDGYQIQRDLYNSSRSHVYLAVDTDTGQEVIIKTPSLEHRHDEAYMERFLMEEWVMKRINSNHVLKAHETKRKRNYLYLVTEYVQGKTLDQWMRDKPKPELEEVRNIVEQVAKGLRAMHRLEMLHQDLRPNNIMIDTNGTVKLIDFGSVSVSGVAEICGDLDQEMLGTMQYTAPEYFIGAPAGSRSDQFSLGVIAYQMLTGQLPYGLGVARATSRAAQNKLNYQSIRDVNRELPVWLDEAIRHSVQVDPYKRYDALSEFIHDLRHPNPRYEHKARPPLLERNPLAFWKGLSLFLFLIIVYLLAMPRT